MDKAVALNTADGESVDAMSDSDKCYICLSPLEKQTVGSLDKCPHFFCFECIYQWSQTANTCPVDRISFAYIHQRRCPGGDIQKKIKVTARRTEQDEPELDWRSVVICEECGRSGRRDRLLVCRQCDSGYHLGCLSPPLNSVPEGVWVCPDCELPPQDADGSLAEEEEEDISDGEVTDLLADVDQTPSTSGRLRPSTVNRPGGFTERRRSARIQSRGGSAGPYPRPQTCWRVPKCLIRASRPAVTAEGSVNPPGAKGSSDKKKRSRRRRRKYVA